MALRWQRSATFFITSVFIASAASCVDDGANAPPDVVPTNTGGNGRGGSGTTGSFETAIGSGGSGTGGGCAGVTKKAEKTPLDILLMLDQSASMGWLLDSGVTGWAAVTSAVEAFVMQPQLDMVSAGIQYFGQPSSVPTCGNYWCYVDADCDFCGPCLAATATTQGICHGKMGGDSCNPADYSTADVEISALPAGAGAIVASMAAHQPSTDTPTSAALQGALLHATSWATDHPGHVVAVVLATDGEPTECDWDLTHIDATAAAGFAATPSIRTFVIGVGIELVSLNGIASAGGTGAAYLVDTGSNAQQQFLAALDAIQGTALGCTYQIPMPDQGVVDYSLINVRYTPGGGGAPETFPQVTDASACPKSGDGWYYDDATKPTEIVLCDATCAKVSGDTTGTIDVVVGCETVVN